MITILSAGTGHPGPLPTADVVFPLAHRFRDPHLDPALRQLTGEHPAVIANVMRQPGATDFLHRAAIACAELAGGGALDLTVLFVCIGGRHRSVAFAGGMLVELARYVHSDTVITLTHRDVGKPVIERPTRLPDYPPETTIFPGFP